MKKKVVKIFSFFGLLIALAVSAQAQFIGQYRVYIPFNFNIGQRNFKAGDYTIGSVSPFASQVLRLHKTKGRGSYITIAAANEDSSQSRVGKLVFNRYGDQYVLTEINMPTLKAEFPKSKFENKLGKMQKPERETIALLR